MAEGRRRTRSGSGSRRTPRPLVDAALWLVRMASQWRDRPPDIEGVPVDATAREARADASAQAVFDWVERTDWVANLATDPATRSNTSVCLSIVDAEFAALDEEAQRAFVKAMTSWLDDEGVAYDIGGYRDAPPGLRIWCGATVETADVEALLPWLDAAFARATAA